MAQDVQGLMIRLEATTQQLRMEMKRADSAVAGATKGIDRQLGQVDKAFDRLNSGAGKVSAAARSLAPALAGLITIEGLRRARQLAEEFTLLEARIKRLSGGTAEAAVTYSRLAEVARNTGSSLGDTVKLWESLTGTLSELGATDAQVVRLTDTLQKIGTIGGSSAQEVSNALRQLGQGLAGGVLRAEEFNSVIEGMPELAREIARGLGVPFGELRQLMLDGELTADKVLGALQSRAIDVDTEFAKLPRTVAQASAALTNDFGQAISQIDEALGGSLYLSKFLDALAKGLRFTAADLTTDKQSLQKLLTDLERLNELTAERARLQQGFEQAERRTLLSSKERANFEQGLKKLNAEILEIQNRRVEQMKEEGRQIQSTAPAVNAEYDKYLAKLKESAALQGVNTEVAKVRYAIEKGELGKLTEVQQQALLKYAQEKDAKVEAAKAGAEYGKSLADQLKTIDAIIARALPERKRVEDLAKAQDDLRKAHAAGRITADEFALGIANLNEQYADPAVKKREQAEKKLAEQLKKTDDQVQSVLDRLDPISKATREYADEQKLLTDAMKRYPQRAAEYQRALDLLGKEYQDNQRKASQWAQWTESALERVDGAFADAWRNIGRGFESFRDSLTNAFRQMLAELAHMAITRPIVMQIGAALGIGGGAGQAVSMMGGSGGSGVGQLLQYGQTAYSALTGVGPAALAGFQSGGIMGGLQGVGSYYGGLASGAASSIGGMFGGVQGGAGVMLDAGGNIVNYGAQATAAKVGTYAPWLSGAAGAFMGYQNSGLKGAVTGGAGGFFGAKGGAALGSAILPGIGTVIGAALGGLLGSTLGSKVFGGDWVTKDGGLALSAVGGEFVGQSYEAQKKKGGLFSSNKKRTRFGALDGETLDALQATFDATQAGVADLFAELSLSVEEGTLDGLQIARKQISTKGKTDEEIQKAISEWFGEAAEAMNAELNKAFATGLDLDLAGMQAFVGNLKGVNEVIRYLNVGMYDASVAGGKLAEDLSAVAGGLEALATSSQTYYSAFFSETERTADTLDSVRRTFADAEIPLANSRAAFRAMVEDIDITTEAGRVMFATMMGLAGQAATYYSIVEQQLLGAASNAFAAVQRSIAAQQKQIQQAYSARVGSLNDMAATASASVSALAGVSNSLEAAIKRLRGTSDDAVRMLRAQATATLQNALTASRAGQSLAGFSGLQDALDVASEMDTALYGSLEEFQREQGRTANLIAELEKVNGKQLSTEQRLLESVQNQLGLAQQKYEADMAGLDAQLSYAQAQLDALNGIDNSVMGVAAAVAAMNAAVVAALGGLPKGAAQANTPQNNRSIIDTIYQSVLGRSTKGDEAGAAFWANALQTGTASYQDIAASIAKGAVGNAAESAASKASAAEFLKKSGIPGFASGGVFGGGLRLVGERGPELEVTGPSRIYSAAQTAAMLSGGNETASEVRALRAEVAGLRGALHSIAKHTEKTAHGVEQIKDIGIPQEEVA